MVGWNRRERPLERLETVEIDDGEGEPEQGGPSGELLVQRQRCFDVGCDGEPAAGFFRSGSHEPRRQVAGNQHGSVTRSALRIAPGEDTADVVDPERWVSSRWQRQPAVPGTGGLVEVAVVEVLERVVGLAG